MKPYFGPKCQSFKRWYGVTLWDEYSNGNYCKSCGTKCVDTRLMLEAMVSARATALYVAEKMKGEDDGK